MKCPFASEFGKWIECPHYERDNDDQCEGTGMLKSGFNIGKGGSWCTTMIGKAMLVHKVFIGNDY